MARPSNQSVERYYFEQFQKHYPLPSGEVTFTDKPDVLIKGASTVGIEIASLYVSHGSDPNSEQVQRQRRKQVIAKAQAIHLAHGGKSIELLIDFQPENPISKIAPVAEALASLAMLIQGQSSDQLSPELFSHIPELRFIYCNSNEYSDARWRAMQAYEAPSLSIYRLREVAAVKSDKMLNYQSCDAYWLLLVVDFMDRAQDQQLDWPSGEPPLCSPYERVLIYKPQFAEVLEVPK